MIVKIWLNENEKNEMKYLGASLYKWQFDAKMCLSVIVAISFRLQFFTLQIDFLLAKPGWMIMITIR